MTDDVLFYVYINIYVMISSVVHDSEAAAVVKLRWF